MFSEMLATIEMPSASLRLYSLNDLQLKAEILLSQFVDAQEMNEVKLFHSKRPNHCLVLFCSLGLLLDIDILSGVVTSQNVCGKMPVDLVFSLKDNLYFVCENESNCMMALGADNLCPIYSLTLPFSPTAVAYNNDEATLAVLLLDARSLRLMSADGEFIFAEKTFDALPAAILYGKKNEDLFCAAYNESGGGSLFQCDGNALLIRECLQLSVMPLHLMWIKYQCREALIAYGIGGAVVIDPEKMHQIAYFVCDEMVSCAGRSETLYAIDGENRSILCFGLCDLTVQKKVRTKGCPKALLLLALSHSAYL